MLQIFTTNMAKSILTQLAKHRHAGSMDPIYSGIDQSDSFLKAVWPEPCNYLPSGSGSEIVISHKLLRSMGLYNKICVVQRLTERQHYTTIKCNND